MGTPSKLDRPGVYRVNVGMDRPTYERLVGGMTDPDYAVLHRFVPHTAQHDRLAARRPFRRGGR